MYANSEIHKREAFPVIPKRRQRKCLCGCGGKAAYFGMANGIALMSGCELSVMVWVRDGAIAFSRQERAKQ